MSRSSTDSTRRSISDDAGLGKRTADDDERSNLSERQKRLRRDGSGLQVEEELAEDIVVVVDKSELQQELGPRTAPSSQPSSSFSSPLSSAPSRLAEDSGETARKAMEAWQNATGLKSDPNGHELSPGRTNTSRETRTVVSPTSPGTSTADGSFSRNWLSPSDDRQHRTPLPAQKESRMLEILSASVDNFANRGGHSAQYFSAQSGETDKESRNTQPINSNASDQPASNHSDEYLRTIAKDSIQLSVRDAPRWHTGIETRQLPPLPPIGMGFPSAGRNLMSRQPQSPSGSVHSFPSSFSVLTSDEVQRNQPSTQGGRRRSKKPPDPGAHRHDDRPTSQGGSADIQTHSFAPRQGVRSDDGQPRSSPEFRNTNLEQSIRRPASAASNMPQIYQVSKSRDFTTSPLPNTVAHGSFRPPPVVFTLDNRAESPLETLEVQPYIESFTQKTTVILLNTASEEESTSHPISVIMWQELSEFYKWYAQLLRVQEIGPLRFELIDVHWQEERSFVVPEGNLNYFRTMKQYVWDLYWFAVHVNKGPSLFRVRVSRFVPQDQRSPAKPDDQWTIAKLGGSPGRLGADLQTHVIVESRPGPLYPHQQPPVRPPMPITIPRSFTHRPEDVHMPSTPNQSGFKRDSITSIHPLNDDRQPIAKVSGHTRSVREQAMLRERAHAYLADRHDLELLEEESTVLDKLPYKTGAEVCGVVVDKRSGKGMVAVTGKGYITLNVKTGFNEPGERYQEVTIQPKQTCMLHGEAVVLFYKRKQASPETAFAPQPKPRSESRGSRPSTASSEVDIVIRLQIDGTGRFSSAFEKSILRPRITTTEFFSFFASQSGHCAPLGPQFLKFTFKDAMPSATSTEIARGNEDHFNYMRKDIKVQCEKARKFMGDLKEFGVLVTVPGWTTSMGDEEEEW